MRIPLTFEQAVDALLRTNLKSKPVVKPQKKQRRKPRKPAPDVVSRDPIEPVTDVMIARLKHLSDCLWSPWDEDLNGDAHAIDCVLHDYLNLKTQQKTPPTES